MLPFERLRALARHAGDDRDLVYEAADCLGDFGADAPQLVTACRRLLVHHSSCGPLWWLCARMLGEPDPMVAARRAVADLDHDRTAARLTAALPFPHDDPIAVTGWPPTIARALEDRPDLDVVVVSSDRRLRTRLRRNGEPVRMLEPAAMTAGSAGHVLVEPVAASPTRAVVRRGVGTVCASLSAAAVWLVVPTGCLLPERLFSSLDRETEDHLDDLELETMALDGTDGLAPPAGFVGTHGFETLDRLARRVDCPAVPELLRL